VTSLAVGLADSLRTCRSSSPIRSLRKLPVSKEIILIYTLVLEITFLKVFLKSFLTIFHGISVYSGAN
jgi:hypothetical protein